MLVSAILNNRICRPVPSLLVLFLDCGKMCGMGAIGGGAGLVVVLVAISPFWLAYKGAKAVGKAAIAGPEAIKDIIEEKKAKKEGLRSRVRNVYGNERERLVCPRFSSIFTRYNAFFFSVLP